VSGRLTVHILAKQSFREPSVDLSGVVGVGSVADSVGTGAVGGSFTDV